MHGSALLWRLLEDYLPDRLLILEGKIPSLPARRLARVEYANPHIRGHRLLFSRFQLQVLPHFFRFAGALIGPILHRAEAFNPGAIVTVAHGFYWQVAAAVAQRLDIPLHLIVHDHVPTTVAEGVEAQVWIEKAFSEVYASARSRLCVSPAMAERYLKWYGASADVLYPSRALRAKVFDAPPTRLGESVKKLTAVFAGSLYQPYAAGMNALARILRREGGRLLVFGPADRSTAGRLGMSGDNIEYRGLIPSGELMAQCRAEADLLYVPMSFGTAERINTTLCFSSKLADYTSVGCPLLIHGPAYSSAVRWARENPTVAEVVDSEESDALEGALAALTSPERRVALGREALRVGQTYFSHDRAKALLRQVLVRERTA